MDRVDVDRLLVSAHSVANAIHLCRYLQTEHYHFADINQLIGAIASVQAGLKAAMNGGAAANPAFAATGTAAAANNKQSTAADGGPLKPIPSGTAAHVLTQYHKKRAYDPNAPAKPAPVTVKPAGSPDNKHSIAVSGGSELDSEESKFSAQPMSGDSIGNLLLSPPSARRASGKRASSDGRSPAELAAAAAASLASAQKLADDEASIARQRKAADDATAQIAIATASDGGCSGSIRRTP